MPKFGSACKSARCARRTRFLHPTGTFRISLTYDAQTGTGKTSAHTDTYPGRFVQLVPNERVVELDEFETADPAMRGEMTITITLTDAHSGGTDLVAVHDGLPPGTAGLPGTKSSGLQNR